MRTFVARLLVLLVGGLVAIPYGVVGIWVVSLWLTVPASLTVASARASSLVVVALLVVPAVLPVTRALERTLANQLLGTRIPEPRRRARPADVARGALFFAGHLVSGGVLILGIAFVVPVLAVLAVDAMSSGGARSALIDQLPGGSGLTQPAALVWGAVVTLVILAVTVGAGYLLPWYARLLLGPSPEEQRAREAEAEARRARRNDLARDVHDSVGHALTVTTMQAAVAKSALERDPDAARAAIAEIERAGRAAVADLDYVLGVLRADDGSAPQGQQPGRTLDDLGALVDEVRSAGVDVVARVSVDARVPGGLSRESYRICQELTTNAMRHARSPHLQLDVRAEREVITIAATNPSDATRVIPGRGISGIRERTDVLGGRADVETGDGEWCVRVELPLRGPQRAAGEGA